MQRVWVAGVFFVFDGPIVYGGRHVHDDHTRYDDFDRSRERRRRPLPFRSLSRSKVG